MKLVFNTNIFLLDVHVLPGFNPHYFLQMLGLHEYQEEDIGGQIFGVVNSVIKKLYRVSQKKVGLVFGAHFRGFNGLKSKS